MRRLTPALLLALLLAAPLEAQGPAAPSLDVVSARSGRELACIEPLHERLGETLRLLREARSQMAMSRHGAQAQEHAAQSARALEQRVRELTTEILACLEAPAPAATSVVLGGERHAAESENVVVPTIDEARPLTDHVRVILGQRVDGEGSVEASAVQDAVTAIGPRLDACYQRLVERGALERGQAFVSFAVNDRARVGRIRVEGVTLGSSGFERCVRAAANHLRVSAPSDRGITSFSYTIGFGPEE